MGNSMTHEEGYQHVLHQLHFLSEFGSSNFGVLMMRIKDWSYAHRRGNGELSDEEQDALIEAAYQRMIAPL